MINETLNTAAKLQSALIVAEAALLTLPKDTPYQDFEQRWLILIFISKKIMVCVELIANTDAFITGLGSGVLRRDGAILQKEWGRQWDHFQRYSRHQTR